jgi:Tfp pilus assembly protein PilO
MSITRFQLVIICLVLALALGGVLVWPRYQTLKNVQFEVQKKEIELQYFEERISELEEISQKLVEESEPLSKIDSALPSFPSFSSLFNFIQQSASQNGLILGDIKLLTIPSFREKKAGEEKSGVKEVEASFATSGSYSGFKNFVSDLETSSRLIEIKNLFLSFRSKEKGPSLKLELKTHCY